MSHDRVRAGRELRAPRVDRRQPRQHVVGELRLAVEAADAGGAAALRPPSPASPAGENALCRSNTGQIVGVARDRCGACAPGSVTMGFSFWRTTSGVSFRKIALPYDFDILRPSVPGMRGAAVSRVFGSGNTGAVEVVEAAHDLAGQLDVRRLVLAHRHRVGLVDDDVGGLQQRVAEEAVGREVLLRRAAAAAPCRSARARATARA